MSNPTVFERLNAAQLAAATHGNPDPERGFAAGPLDRRAPILYRRAPCADWRT
jgi:hypothetical protein